MRQIGSVADEEQSRLIAEYLLARGMPAHSEPEGQHWSIWVREENDVEPAKRVLLDFLHAASHQQYEDAVETARRRRQEELQHQVEAARKAIESSASSRPSAHEPLSRRAPLVMVLIGLTLFVGLITDVGNLQNDLFHALMTVDLRLFPESSDGFRQIRSGQLWRLITPVFLHGGWLHLLFNMSWVYYFGSQIEQRRGTVPFGILVLVLALASNLTQLVTVGPNFVGMSGVVYGLFGFVWVQQLTARGPSQPYILSDFSIFILLFFLVMGFASVLEGWVGDEAAIANGAHVGGLVSGLAISLVDAFARR